LLREFLREDGSIWVTIDDNEGHYLKVLMDEVFGRGSFVVSCVWQKRYSRENRGAIGDVHDYLHVYARNPVLFKQVRNLIPLDEHQAKIYRNPDNPTESDPSKRWRGLPMTAQGYRPNQMYEIIAPNGTRHKPPDGRCWSTVESEFLKLKQQGRIYWGKDGRAQPSVIRFLSEVAGLVPWTWWPHDDAGHTDEAKKEANELFGADASFGTPKPERLNQRILQIATNPGDLILDSFLGSGTTAAVAHKMGRRWIGIEMGEHAVTHCLPRLRKVVEGEQGGISQAVNWQGGGGFRFVQLGAPLFDAHGDLHPEVKFADLAAFLWLRETGTACEPADAGTTCPTGTPLLGVFEGRAIYLLYNGMLGDRRPAAGQPRRAVCGRAAPGFSAGQQRQWRAVALGAAGRGGRARDGGAESAGRADVDRRLCDGRARHAVGAVPRRPEAAGRGARRPVATAAGCRGDGGQAGRLGAMAGRRAAAPFAQRGARCAAGASAGKAAFRQLVLDGGWELAAGPAFEFHFEPHGYPVPGNQRYAGKFRMAKHFYPVLAALEDGSEEMLCALALDSHPGVKRWVRNLDSEPVHAFWLPTSSGRFLSGFRLRADRRADLRRRVQG
jgi:adenine-specific DNA-methyltransferase